MGRGARAIALVGLSVFSTVLTVGTLQSSTPLPSWIKSNAMELDHRLAWLVYSFGAAALAAVVLTGIVIWRRSSVSLLTRVARLLGPLALAPVVPGFLAREPWIDDELGLLALLGIFGLVAERLLRGCVAEVLALATSSIRTFERRIPRSVRLGVPLLAVAALVGWYCVVIGKFVVLSHERMATSSSDLAEFDNLFFNALHGYPFRAPAIEGSLVPLSALKIHAEFGLYLLLPFYALRPGPEALLIIQTAVVALTAIPVYVFAAGRAGAWAGLVCAWAYLLFPAVQRPNFYDYHFTPLGMFMVMWLLVFVDRLYRAPAGQARRGDWFGFSVFFALALLCREDVAIGLAALGVFLFFTGRFPLVGPAMAGVAAAYFVGVKFGIMEHFGKMWFDAIYQSLKAPGAKGFGAIIQTLLTNPAFVFRSLSTEAKLLYVAHMTVPLLFLWLRRSWLGLAVVPGLISTLLVTDRAPMYTISFQYTYLWVPYVVAAAAIGLETQGHTAQATLGRSRRVAATVALALVAFFASFNHGALFGAPSILGGFGPKLLSISEAERARTAQLRELVSMIPPEASVAATEQEGPHVSTRLVMYSLKFTWGDYPDYLLVGPHPHGGERRNLLAAVQTGEYGQVARKGPFRLLQRGRASSAGTDRLVNEFRRGF